MTHVVRQQAEVPKPSQREFGDVTDSEIPNSRHKKKFELVKMNEESEMKERNDLNRPWNEKSTCCSTPNAFIFSTRGGEVVRVTTWMSTQHLHTAA